MAINITRLFDIILYQNAKNPNLQLFNYKHQNHWAGISVKNFVEQGNQLSMGMLQQGIKKGDLVTLVSTSRYEWHLIDFAISQIGAICVPLYTSLTAEEYGIVLQEAKPKMIFVSNITLLKNIENAMLIQKIVMPIYTIDDIENAINFKYIFKKNIDEQALQKARMSIEPLDLLTIIYTSGTEGKPKGVMLSHENVVSNIKAFSKLLNVGEKDKAITFLPLNHIYEKTVSYFFLSIGCPIFYAESLAKVIENIKEVQPTIFTSIPLMMKKIYDKIIEKGNTLKGFKQKIFNWSMQLAKQWDNEKPTSISYAIQLYIANKLVYSKWREALGGKIKIIASGSAAINPLLLRVFNGAGIHLLEGYGLTETSPVVALNLPNKNGMKIGTVGKVLEGVQVKIANDGEILIKGTNVMMGYYLQEQQTKEVLSHDGWFSSGDIGELIDGVFLKITDRKKELFKTSGGKYVSPQYLEGKLKESLFVENAMVIGANENVIAAIIQPNWEAIKKYCISNDIEYKNEEHIIMQKEIIALLKNAIDQANKQVASHEKIRRYELVPDTWSIAGYELTPTLKIKRRVIADKYQHLFKKIYGSIK